jgi:hypothetical protein
MIMSDAMSGRSSDDSSRATTETFSTNPESDFALWTNSAEMVNNIFSLCKFLWRTAKPLKTLEAN